MYGLGALLGGLYNVEARSGPCVKLHSLFALCPCTSSSAFLISVSSGSLIEPKPDATTTLRWLLVRLLQSRGCFIFLRLKFIT